jgi:hypothetical protein
MSLVIQIRDRKTDFSPRESVVGDVSWQLDAPPKSAELRLLWRTSGRGVPDVCVVETVNFENPQATETRPFAFTLPEGPYSFSGALITLKWGLELNIDSGDQAACVDIVVGPGGTAVKLPRVQAVE